MTEGWVDYLTGPWGFAFAFAAGLLSFLSPCVLPLVPAYLAHMTGTAAGFTDDAAPERVDRRLVVQHAVAFVAGFGIVFTVIGASVGFLAATLGADDQYLVRDRVDLLAKIGGVFLIVLGLNMIGVIRIPWLYRTYTLETRAAAPQIAVADGGPGGAMMTMSGGVAGSGPALRYVNSAGVGAAFAVGWTPCIGPVLGAIITLAAASGDVARGAYLLLVYSAGLGVPFIITGMAVLPITRFLRRHRGWLPLVEIVMGVMVISIGALIFLDDMTIFNRYFDFFGLSEI